MGLSVVTRTAVVRRSEADTSAVNGLVRGVTRRLQPHALSPVFSCACPELECVRNLLPRRVVLAAERRAQLIGMGADRVLISADAITEEAYLEALATSLGTCFQRLDNVARADCPLDEMSPIRPV